MLRYVYAQTPDAQSGKNDPLRNVVAAHAVKNAKTLSNSKAFMDLMAEGGQIVKDIISGLV